MTLAAVAGAGGGLKSPSAARPPVRVMIVDDSPVARAVLARMVGATGEFEVAAAAGDSAEALRLLREVEVDVVLLDVEMPGGSGLDALPQIVRESRGARVLIVSSFCGEGSERSAGALGEGRVEMLSKPGSGACGGRFSDILIERLRRLGRSSPSREAIVGARAEATALRCLAIGASTGGLTAVTTLLQALPERIGVPILVTQHLPAAFVPFFGRHIEESTGRSVRIAESGAALLEDEILLAPGNAHLSLSKTAAEPRVELCREPVASGCMPSVDVMLEAVARQYGSGAGAVILSGMGRDGLDGCRRIAESGGEILAQDRESSAVWGMPRAVAEAGLGAAVLTPAAIAARLAARAEASRCR